MASYRQLIKRRLRKPKNNKVERLPPFIAGIVVKAYTMSPKKPNSASRKVAKVKVKLKTLVRTGIDNFKKVTKTKFLIVKIPGEGHDVREHSHVVLKRTRAKDCPGVRFSVLRGVGDVSCVANKKQGRSKKGTKKPASVAKKK